MVPSGYVDCIANLAMLQSISVCGLALYHETNDERLPGGVFRPHNRRMVYRFQSKMASSRANSAAAADIHSLSTTDNEFSRRSLLSIESPVVEQKSGNPWPVEGVGLFEEVFGCGQQETL